MARAVPAAVPASRRRRGRRKATAGVGRPARRLGSRRIRPPDGTPRCTAIWFHWNGTALVVSSPVAAPKTRAIRAGDPIAVTIDDAEFPYASLNLRGTADVDQVEGMAPEYRAAARRYLGDEQGDAWCDQMPDGGMTRVRLTPDWVGLIDIDGLRRLPSALAG